MNARKVSVFRAVVAIAKVTVREILRDRVLYNVIVFAVLLTGLAYIASNLSFIQPYRILLDFGVAGVSVASGFLAIMLGSALLNREFERRTIYVALSRPISRFHFLIGKYTGMAAVLALNWVFLVLVIVSALMLMADPEKVSLVISPTLVAAFGLLLFQSLMLGAVAMLFSTISTTAIASMITIGLFLIGTNVSQIRLVAAKSSVPLTRTALEAISQVIPNFEIFNLGIKVTYSLPVPGAQISSAIAYACVWMILALCAAGLLIRTKES